MHRPRRFGSTLPLAFLELEPRITPVVGYKQLGDIEFYGDYIQVGTTYTFSGQGFGGDTVQLGYATNGDPAENFDPLMLIQGDVTFDLSAEKHVFTVANGSAAGSSAQVRTAPIGTFDSLFVASGPQSIDADALVADGFRYDDSAVGPQSASIGGVTFTINTFGIGLDPVAGSPTLEFRGSLLLGGDEKGLTVAVNGPNFVYVEPDGTPNLTGAAVSFSNTFELRGLEISVNNAGLLYDGQTSTFEVFGSVSETIPTDAETKVGNGEGADGKEETNTLTLDFGDPSAPGIQVTNGEFVEIAFAVTGEFELGRLQFKAESLGLEYVAESDEFLLSGGASIGLTKGIQAGVELGTGTGNPGIVVKDGDWEVDDIALSLGGVSLGGFTLNDLRLSFSQEGGEIAYGGAVSVSFPGNWSVAGALSFVGGSLDDIALGLTFGEEGIPVADTGVFLVAMGASVQNLDNPSNLIVSGSLSFDFGGQIAVKVNGSEKTVNLVRWNGTFSASADYLKLNAGVFFGALTTTASNGQPVVDGSGLPTTKGYFGSATGTLDFDWGSRTYRGEVDATFIGGAVKAKAGFDLASDYTFTVYAGATLNVPDRVPLIGGDKLLSGTAVFQYNPSDKTAYLAAWSEVLFVQAGFEYTLNGFNGDSNNFSLIGSDTIGAIQSSLNTPPPPQTFYYGYSSTPADQSSTAATFQFDWGQTGGNQSVQVVVPNGGSGQTVTLSSAQPTANAGELRLTLTATGGNRFVVQVTQVGAAKAYNPLPAGSFSLTLVSTVQLAGVKFTPTYAYTPPAVSISAVTTTSSGFTVNYTGNVAGGLGAPQVTLFIDRDGSGRDGTQIARLTPSLNGTAFSGSFNWNTLAFKPGKYTVYAQVNDSKNGSTFSQYFTRSGQTSPLVLTVTSPFSGSVQDQNGGLTEIAVTVYIDLNGDGVFQQSEPSTQTVAGDGGRFAFVGGTLTNGVTYTANVLAPYGYLPADPFTFKYSAATPPVKTFVLTRLNSVSGYVYSDDNGNGIRDAGEPGLSAGFSVGDGPTAITPNPDGYYAFDNRGPSGGFGVQAYSQQGFARTQGAGGYSISFAASDTTKTYTNQNFGFRRLATISGTVTGYRVNIDGVAQTASPVPGATVQLLNPANGQVAFTSTTDANGNYAFTGLTPDITYTVVQTPPPGWRQIAPQAPAAPAFTTSDGGVSPVTLMNQPVPFAVADFDGDGFADIAQAVSGSGIRFLRGRADGGYDAVGTVSALDYGLTDGPSNIEAIARPGSVGLAIIDINAYIAFLNIVSLNPLKIEATYRGRFADYIGVQPGSAVVGDLNNDGSDDVLYNLGAVPPGPTHFFGFAQTAPSVSLNSNTYVQGGPHPALGDVNGDGVLDLIRFGDFDRLLTVAYLSVNGNLASPNGSTASLSIPSGGNYPINGFIAAADIDGDGFSDAVWTSQSGSPDAIAYTFNRAFDRGVLNETTSGFIKTYGTANSTIRAVLVRDINNDFLPDIVVARDSTIDFYLNSGTAPYFVDAPSYTVETSSSYRSIRAYDLTGDGLVDFVAHDQFGGKFLFLTNITTTQPLGFSVTTSPTADTTGLDFLDGQITATGTVGGVSYDDLNRNGALDPGDLVLANQTVFLDLNRNGRFDLNEPTRVTDANGLYAFTGLAPGEYAVGLVVPRDRLVAARGTAMHTVNLTADAGFGTADFGSYVSDPVVLVMPDGNGADEWTAYRNGERLEIRDDRTGILVLNRLLSELRSVTVLGSAGEANTLRIDLGGGDLTEAGLFSFRGGSGRDTLHLIGGVGDDAFDLTGTGGSAKGVRLAYSGLDLVRVDGLGGSDSIRLRPDAAVEFAVDGGEHGTAGDKLDLDLSLATGVTRGEGVWTFGNARRVTFTGFESVTPAPAVPPVVPPVVPVPPVGPAVVTAVGSRVVVTGPDGQVLRSFPAFEESFTGGVSVALGDLTGDGVPDVVVGAGAGGGPRVRVFDGATGATLRDFFAFEPGFTGGVSVAVGDVTGDGVADVVVGAGAGGGPRVRVFDGVTGQVVRDFFAFEPGFAGGVSVAVGDLDGDGFADIVVGAGVGGGPRVRAFSGRDSAVLADFFAYAPDATVGVNVAVGDLDGDGRVEIVTGAMTAAPHVAVFTAAGAAVRSFFAFEPAAGGGVSVAAGDLTGDGVADIAAGAGPGGGPRVRVFDGATEAALRDEFASEPTARGGVTVAAATTPEVPASPDASDPTFDFLGGVPVA